MLAGKGSDLIFKSRELTHFDAVLVKKEQTHVIGEVPSIFSVLTIGVLTTEAGWRKAVAQNESGVYAVKSPAVWRSRTKNAHDSKIYPARHCRYPIRTPVTQLSPNCG